MTLATLPGINLVQYTTERGSWRSALVLGLGPKWARVALIEADGFRQVSLPRGEERWFEHLEVTERRRRLIRNIARRSGTHPSLRKTILALTKRQTP